MQTAAKVIGAFLFIWVLCALIWGNREAPPPVFIEEESKDVILDSVFDHGAIADYKIRSVRPLDLPELPDGVYLLNITTGLEAETNKPPVDPKKLVYTTCILIKDVIGYREASYAYGMLDCDKLPQIATKYDKVELKALSQGNLLDNVGRGIHEIVFPANIIPGYEKPIKCIFMTDIQGAMAFTTGWSGMSCDFASAANVPP